MNYWFMALILVSFKKSFAQESFVFLPNRNLFKECREIFYTSASASFDLKKAVEPKSGFEVGLTAEASGVVRDAEIQRNDLDLSLKSLAKLRFEIDSLKFQTLKNNNLLIQQLEASFFIKYESLIEWSLKKNYSVDEIKNFLALEIKKLQSIEKENSIKEKEFKQKAEESFSKLKIFNPQEENFKLGQEEIDSSKKVSFDGKYFILYEEKLKKIKIFGSDVNKEILSLEAPENYLFSKMSEDGKYILIYTWHFYKKKGFAKVIELINPRNALDLIIEERPLDGMLTYDGNHLISLNYLSEFSKAVSIIDLKKEQKFLKETFNQYLLNEVILTKDGKYLILIFRDGKVNFYNVGTWSLAKSFLFSSFAAAKLSDSHENLILSSSEGLTKIINILTWSETLIETKDKYPLNPQLSPDNKYFALVSDPNILKVFDIETGKLLLHKEYHDRFQENVLTPVFTKDSQYFLIPLSNGKIEIVSTKNWENIRIFELNGTNKDRLSNGPLAWSSQKTVIKVKLSENGDYLLIFLINSLIKLNLYSDFNLSNSNK